MLAGSPRSGPRLDAPWLGEAGDEQWSPVLRGPPQQDHAVHGPQAVRAAAAAAAKETFHIVHNCSPSIKFLVICINLLSILGVIIITLIVDISNIFFSFNVNALIFILHQLLPSFVRSRGALHHLYRTFPITCQDLSPSASPAPSRASCCCSYPGSCSYPSPRSSPRSSYPGS